MPLLALLIPVVALIIGAFAALAARVQGGSRGIMGFAVAPLAVMFAVCAVWGGAVGAVAGLTATTFGAGLHFGGFTIRPLLVRMRLAVPEAHVATWS